MKNKIYLTAGILLLAASCQKNFQAVNSFDDCVSAGGAVAGGVVSRTCNFEGTLFYYAGQPDQSGQPDDSGWQSYGGSGFTIKYPADFSVQDEYDLLSATGYIPVCDQSMSVCFVYTGDAYKGTNFENAGVSVNLLDFQDQKSCYNFAVPTNQAQQPVSDVDINGVMFKSATGGDAGAGHFTKTQVYRNFYSGKCYEIAQRVGSTNIGNYTPGTVQEFNQDEVWAKLQGIVNTFSFVKSQADNSYDFGQSFLLHLGQQASLSGGDVKLKLTGFYYHPCPKGKECFWAGLDVYYELTANGQTYVKNSLQTPADMPYNVAIGQSDYQTYANFTVTQR